MKTKGSARWLRRFGVRWDYVEDSETAAITLAQVGEDGVLIWSGG